VCSQTKHPGSQGISSDILQHLKQSVKIAWAKGSHSKSVQKYVQEFVFPLYQDSRELYRDETKNF
jgi:hypothetical protein